MRPYLCKSHPDFHLPAVFDAGDGFDGEEYGRKLKESGVDAIVFFAKCHYGHAYYHTKLGTRHPRLKKDMLREVERGCQAHELGLIPYYSVFYDTAAVIANPDWALQATEKAKSDAGFDSGVYRMLCVNSPYLEELLIPQSIEIATQYAAAEIFFDTMTGFQPCYCPRCQKLYGGSIPNAKSSDWLDYVHWYADCYSRFFARAAEEISRAKPDVGITFNWEWGTRRPTPPPPGITRLAADLIPSDHVAAQQVRYFAGTGYPSDYMIGRFLHGLGDWDSNTPESLLLTAATTVANGSSFYLIDRQLPDGSLEPRAYDAMKTVFGFIQERRHVLEGAVHVPEIAVLHSYASIMGPNLEFFPDPDARKKRMESFEGVVRMFTDHGRHFTALSMERLMERLHDYRVVILPEQEYLDPKLLTALHEFVEKGGRLIITQAGIPETVDPAIMKMAGVCYQGHTTDSSSKTSYYCYLAGEKPIAMRGRMAQVTLENAQTLCPALLPLDIHGEISFGHGFAPPSTQSPYPGATLKKQGHGEIIYVALPFFKSYGTHQNPHAAKLFLSWLDQVLPDPIARISTPAQVELSLLRKQDDLILHLVNHSGRERLGGYWYPVTEYIPEIRDIELEINLPWQDLRIFSALTMTELHPTINSARARLTVPSLRIMESFLVPDYFRTARR